MYTIDEYFIRVNRGEIYPKVIEETEREVIEKALQFSFGNKILAAKILGIHRNTLRTKIKKLHITADKFKQ